MIFRKVIQLQIPYCEGICVAHKHALKASQRLAHRKTIPNGSLNTSYVLGIKRNGWHLISLCQINKELKNKNCVK